MSWHTDRDGQSVCLACYVDSEEEKEHEYNFDRALLRTYYVKTPIQRDNLFCSSSSLVDVFNLSDGADEAGPESRQYNDFNQVIDSSPSSFDMLNTDISIEPDVDEIARLLVSFRHTLLNKL